MARLERQADKEDPRMAHSFIQLSQAPLDDDMYDDREIPKSIEEKNKEKAEMAKLEREADMEDPRMSGDEVEDDREVTRSIEEKNRDITNKSDEKATAEGDKTAAEEAKETAMNEQQQNMNENADLHKSCDFVLKNFDIRQAARDQEVEALRQAKAILSGAKLGFLQKNA